MLPHATTIAPGFLGWAARSCARARSIRSCARSPSCASASSAMPLRSASAQTRRAQCRHERRQDRGAGGRPASAVFSPLEQLIIRYTDEVVKNVKASDALFKELLAQLDNRRMAELTLTIGFYMAVSRFLENFEVDIEPAPPAAGVAGQVFARIREKHPCPPPPTLPTRRSLASVHPETLGQAPSHGRLKGRRIIVVGAGQRKVVDTDRRSATAAPCRCCSRARVRMSPASTSTRRLPTTRSTRSSPKAARLLPTSSMCPTRRRLRPRWSAAPNDSAGSTAWRSMSASPAGLSLPKMTAEAGTTIMPSMSAATCCSHRKRWR